MNDGAKIKFNQYMQLVNNYIDENVKIFYPENIYEAKTCYCN